MLCRLSSLVSLIILLHEIGSADPDRVNFSVALTQQLGKRWKFVAFMDGHACATLELPYLGEDVLTRGLDILEQLLDILVAVLVAGKLLRSSFGCRFKNFFYFCFLEEGSNFGTLLSSWSTG